MQNLQEAEQALSKAKIRMMMRQDAVFLTTVCLSLKQTITDTVPTAATNGLTLLFNPDFLLSLTIDEQVFVLLHETLHAALTHPSRAKGRDAALWNEACDYVVNSVLIDDMGMTMPKCKGLYDTQYKGLSVEEIYIMLQKNPDKQSKPNGLGQDLSVPESPTEDVKAQMDDILVRASLQSKMANQKAGSIPGDLQIYIDKLLNPRLSWEQLLRRFMNAFAKTDTSFNKPNRRYFPDHILPTQYGHALDEIAVAVDTSGSISEEEFQHFIAETHTILKRLKPKKISFIQFDHKLQGIDEVRTAADLMKVKFSGRGGTNIEPVIDWAAEHKPVCLIIFTDGYFTHSEVDPKCPVLWVIHSNSSKYEVPYGKVIPYEFNGTS